MVDGLEVNVEVQPGELCFMEAIVEHTITAKLIG